MSPLAIVVIAAAIFTAGVVTAATHTFVPWVTIPVGAILAIGGLSLLRLPATATRSDVIVAAIVLVFAIVWVVAQLPYATEYLRPSRDPGIYTLTGIWLAQHGTPSIDVTSGLDRVEGIAGLTASLGPFSPEADGNIRLQGGDGAPTIVGLGYWAAGLPGALTANLVMGGVALLAVYALARRVLRSPVGALGVMAVLGVSLPFVYFSRAPYTEIATLGFFAAATASLMDAVRSGGRPQLLLGGALAGVACMTRIDTSLALAAMLAALAFVMVMRLTDASVRRLGAFLIFAVPALTFAGVGTLDLLVNYRRYVGDLGTQVALLWVFLAVVTGACLVAVVAVRRRAAEPGRISRRALMNWWFTISALCVALLAFWLIRPLWLHYRLTTSHPYQVLVSQLQAQEGLEVDPTRSYDEYSLWWFAWYFGPLMIALMSIGIVLLLRRALPGRDPGVWALLVPVLGVAALYLDLISISPDQPWAFRRVLPVVTPGLVIASVLVIERLWVMPRRRWMSRVAAVILIIMAGLGLRISWSAPLVTTTHLGGVKAETAELCAAVRGHDIVVAEVSDNGAATLKMVCGVDVVGFSVDTADERTDALAKLVADGLDVVVVTESPDSLAWKTAPPPPTVIATFQRWTSSLLDAPEGIVTTTRSTWVAEVAADGTLLPG